MKVHIATVGILATALIATACSDSESGPPTPTARATETSSPAPTPDPTATSTTVPTPAGPVTEIHGVPIQDILLGEPVSARDFAVYVRETPCGEFECSPSFNLHRIYFDPAGNVAREMLFEGVTPDNGYVTDIDLAPGGRDILITQCEVGNCGLGHDYLTADARVALYRSTDGGESWSREHSTAGWGEYQFASDGRVLYIETTPPDGPQDPFSPDYTPTGNEREGTGKWETQVYEVPSMNLIADGSVAGDYPLRQAAPDELVLIDETGQELIRADGSTYFALNDPSFRIANFHFYPTAEILHLTLTNESSGAPQVLWGFARNGVLTSVLAMPAESKFALIDWTDSGTGFGELVAGEQRVLALFELETGAIRALSPGQSYSDDDTWTFGPRPEFGRKIVLGIGPSPLD